MQIIQKLPPKFPDNTWVALDLELANAVKSKLHRPTTGEFACLTVCADPETVYIITDQYAVNEVLQGLSNCIWIFHNAKFDLIHLLRWAGIQHERIWDTMIVEQLLWSGYFGSFSLADLARRYLDIYLDKTLQDKWDEVDLHNIPQNYLEYAAGDASTTLKVCMAQKKYVKQSHFDLWYKMELPVIWAVMGFQGFCVDVDKWLALSETNRTKAEEVDATLPINPRSPKQVREYLSKNGFRAIPSTGEDVLNQWIARKPDTVAAKVAAQILESRMHSKRASTYGKKWVEEHVEYVDGLPMVFGNYHTIGAETGRFCVSGDTVLCTNLGNFEIQDLYLQKDKKYRIMSHTGKLQNITNKFYKGKELMYELHTENGCNIKCTGNHRILTPRGWKLVQDMEIGDLAITQDNSSSPTNIEWKGFDYGRGDICRISYTAQDEPREDMYAIPDDYKAHCLDIEKSLQEKIRGSIKENEILSILNGFAREFSWEEKSTFSSNREGRSITFSEFWKEVVSYSQRTRNKRVCSSSKFQISCHRPERRIAFWLARVGLRIFGVVRTACSWFIRCSKKLLRCSTSILRKVVRRVLKVVSNYLVHQRTSIRTCLLSREKQSRKRTHLLEQQQGRNDFGFSPIREAYSTYSAIQLLSEISSRFLLPTSQINLGTTRWNTWPANNRNRGQEKERHNPETWIQLPRDSERHGSQGLAWSNEFTGSKITSIQECGVLDVWDIEVENDHSYVAGGFVNHNSCSAPNMQNIPARETKEFRACFVARPKHKLIIADYSQQEVGIAAYISKDKHLMEIFNSGQDIYIQMAKLMYDVDIDKKNPLRARMKSVVLGTNYGMSAYGLAKKEGITEEEAEDILRRVARAFPGLTSWMNTQQKCKSKTTTVMGRVAWLNSYSGQCPRNALNNPIQGTAGDMLKMAMVKIHAKLKTFPIYFPMVAAIHDELVLDVPEIWVEDVAKIVQDTMVEVANDMMPGMSFRASVAIGSNWSEKE